VCDFSPLSFRIRFFPFSFDTRVRAGFPPSAPTMFKWRRASTHGIHESLFGALRPPPNIPPPPRTSSNADISKHYFHSHFPPCQKIQYIPDPFFLSPSSPPRRALGQWCVVFKALTQYPGTVFAFTPVFFLCLQLFLSILRRKPCETRPSSFPPPDLFLVFRLPLL